MHGHDHDRDHEAHAPIQDHADGAYYEKLAWAIQSLLVAKGVLTADEVRAQIEDTDSRTPALGAKVIARAWVDPAFKARLLANAKEAIAELGIDTGSSPVLVAVENTDRVHNVIVCTLCSCYPRALLGRPPDWYKSLNYRARVVADPRGVLREFGLELEPDVEVRVFDSTADMRYLVIPQRPAGTEHLSEEELAQLVTRDSMIGVTRARQPGVTISAPA
jgi:nitrile hydratase alpha subunit